MAKNVPGLDIVVRDGEIFAVTPDHKILPKLRVRLIDFDSGFRKQRVSLDEDDVAPATVSELTVDEYSVEVFEKQDVAKCPRCGYPDTDVPSVTIGSAQYAAIPETKQSSCVGCVACGLVNLCSDIRDKAGITDFCQETSVIWKEVP